MLKNKAALLKKPKKLKFHILVTKQDTDLKFLASSFLPLRY